MLVVLKICNNTGWCDMEESYENWLRGSIDAQKDLSQLKTCLIKFPLVPARYFARLIPGLTRDFVVQMHLKHFPHLVLNASNTFLCREKGTSKFVYFQISSMLRDAEKLQTQFIPRDVCKNLRITENMFAFQWFFHFNFRVIVPRSSLSNVESLTGCEVVSEPEWTSTFLYEYNEVLFDFDGMEVSSESVAHFL